MPNSHYGHSESVKQMNLTESERKRQGGEAEGEGGEKEERKKEREEGEKGKREEAGWTNFQAH